MSLHEVITCFLNCEGRIKDVDEDDDDEDDDEGDEAYEQYSYFRSLC